MSLIVDEAELPLDLSLFDAVEAAYPDELSNAHGALQRGLPVMIECDKELTPFMYKSLRDRLKQDGRTCLYLDGRPDPNAAQQGGMPMGMMGTIIAQLRDAVRGAVDQRVVVLPHLDLLTTSSGGLTGEAREVIPLLYENPNLMWIGFKDPSFRLPKVILNLFPHHESIIGVSRDRLRYLVTRREARKFGTEFNPYGLYKHISGVNAIRLRRLLASVSGEDYPTDPSPAFSQLRNATLASGMQVPDLSMEDDIGGYEKVKKRLRKEILQILAFKDAAETSEDVDQIEGLIPKGMIFYGPPGTGKTMFAKAMATSLGAAVHIVSGPELKSRWVGESEENIRRVFVQARKSAPAIIVFDELDSMAPARGTYTGSGVEHSMVNQLLTEMDGFRSNETVFVVGTTNFPESLDAALLRPGRFEFHLHIPFPNAEDRGAIFEIYNNKMRLQMSDKALEYAVKRTDGFVEGQGTRYTGDHINALCRAIARRRIRETLTGPTEPSDVEIAMIEYIDRPELTSAEEFTVATHECGHALVGIYCEHTPPIERISILGDLGGALGYVQHENPENQYVYTREQLLDMIAVGFGGREAEEMLLPELSIGSAQDLERATGIARSIVEMYGMGSAAVGPRMYTNPNPRSKDPELSDAMKSAIEADVLRILSEQKARARAMLEEHRDELIALRDLLLEKKLLDKFALEGVVQTQQTE